VTLVIVYRIKLSVLYGLWDQLSSICNYKELRNSFFSSSQFFVWRSQRSSMESATSTKKIAVSATGIEI